MKTKRNIIEIDEEKCNGCGQCVIGCAEGALQIVDGKARLVGEVYCDGLGACIGECPMDALRVVEREADQFDEEAVEELLEKKKKEEAGKAALGCGCPSAAAMTFDRNIASAQSNDVQSELTHFPIKLQLLNPMAPFLKGTDMLLLSDCSAASYPNLHRDILKGHTVALGCPKLDDVEAHIARLTDILAHADLKSLTVVTMEVPCCGGLMYIAEKAKEASGSNTPIKRIITSRDGQIIKR
jgi:Fe-S-cluster-containing hydrogenase component 2